MHFCMLVELTKLDAFTKLFKHRSEYVVKVDAYHPYIQFVRIVLSILMKMRLLWLPFNDSYTENMCIIG